NRYVIENRKVLDVLTQTYSASMGTNRNAKLRRHEQYGEHFINSSEATAVYLAEVDRSGLQQLFEHYAVVTVFTRSDCERSDRSRNGCVAQDVVGRSWFLDPVRTKHRQFPDTTNGFFDIPNLIRVH